MSRMAFLLLAGLCLVQGLGCRAAAEAEVDETPLPAVSTDFSRLSELLTGIQKSARPQLYEGLPGEFWEPELRARELLRKETLDIHGHPVYEEPLTLSGADADQLTAVFSDLESYRPFNVSSRKKCGGFTAEHCVEWTSGETVTQLLICQECGEVMLFGPQSELHCDLTPEAAQQIKQLLASYRQHNPSESPSPRADSGASR